MAKDTQNYKLYELMKTGEVISKENLAKSLGVALVSVPVYIHELKSQFKADIISVRDGRRVVGYKLITKTLKVPQYRKNSVEVVKKITANNVVGIISNDGSVPIIDRDADVAQFSDREFDDIRSSLALEAGSHTND